MSVECICHHPDRPEWHTFYCPQANGGKRRFGSLTFVRSPLMDSGAEAQEWLIAQGCERVEWHQGPDGLWRGSGVLASPVPTLTDAERAALELAERSGI